MAVASGLALAEVEVFERSEATLLGVVGDLDQLTSLWAPSEDGPLHISLKHSRQSLEQVRQVHRFKQSVDGMVRHGWLEPIPQRPGAIRLTAKGGLVLGALNMVGR